MRSHINNNYNYFIQKLPKQMLEDFVLLINWSLFREEVMNIKCDVIVDAWLDQIVGTGCEVGIALFTLAMPATKLYPVQVCVK